jgi:hypothetical protein
MLADPFVTTKIHSHRPMAIEFSLCHWMATEFNLHVTMETKNLLVTTMSFPPPTLIFYPFFTFPLMTIKTFLVTILCDPLINKWGYLWNPLGT